MQRKQWLASLMRLVCIGIFVFMGWPLSAQIDKAAIEQIIQGRKASVGVSVWHQDEVVVIGNDEYPLMSVFKYHVGVTALKEMECRNIPLDSVVRMSARWIRTNTYSPLRERFGRKGVMLSFRELLDYTVGQSDNNTCDFLIDFVGGISRVEDYIRSLGVEEIHLVETEESMHSGADRYRNNWSTPLETVRLMRKVDTQQVLCGESRRCLDEIMLQTPTGANKLKAGFPISASFSHKTGSTGVLSDGTVGSDNDAGILYLPDGTRCYVAVFIKDSEETLEANARIMADIARVVYQGIMKKAKCQSVNLGL